MKILNQWIEWVPSGQHRKKAMEAMTHLLDRFTVLKDGRFSLAKCSFTRGYTIVFQPKGCFWAPRPRAIFQITGAVLQKGSSPEIAISGL